MPRPPETPDVRASKTLSYILRHGAEKESLHIRSDGYIKLADVLARPKMRDVDLEMVLRIVADNAKQRFELFYGYDPSPPPPKSRKGNKTKGKGKQEAPKPTQSNPVDTSAGPEEAGGQEGEKNGAGTGADNIVQSRGEIDAAKIEDLSHDIAKSSLGTTELPLISLPLPTDDETVGSDLDRGEYFIRATQGHSIKLESNAHLEPVEDTPEGRSRAGKLVHGTKWELWDVLLQSGLSRMNRTHIHLAPALSDHRILPRPNSTLRIYLDLPKMLAGGIPVYTSLNGVVLTPGDEQGIVEIKYWRKAERKMDGNWVTVLENGTVLNI